MNRIIVNGVDYTTECEGLEDFTLDIARNTDDGSVEYGASLSIKATGTFYTLIYDTFFAYPCEGKKNSLDVNIQIDNGSCEFSLDFVLRPEAVDLCHSGCADIVLKYEQPEDAAYLCLKNQNTFWSDPGFYDFIKSRTHKILYCQDYTFVTYLLFFLYLVTIKLFVDFFQKLCDIVDFLGIDIPKFCSIFDKLENAVVGCNKYYTDVLIKDIFEYNLSKCGLQLESDILNDNIYKWLALESALNEEGFNITKCANSNAQFDQDNAPILNVLQIAKLLEPVFNSDFRIKNGLFMFYRKDKFYEGNPALVNIDTDNLDECPKYQYDSESIKAFWDINFALDGMDFQGNKRINDYNEIVEWNPTGNTNIKGRRRLNATFTPSKWSHDRGVIDGNEQQFLANIRTGNGFFAIGTCDFTHAQIVQDGQMTQNKLLLIDPNQSINCSGCKFATVQKRKISNGGGGFYPFAGFKFAYDYNEGLKGQKLYDNFHYIDDPNGNEARFIKVDQVVWYPTDFCESVQTILDNGLLVEVTSDYYGTTIPEKISIDFTNCTISLFDLRFKCLN